MSRTYKSTKLIIISTTFILIFFVLYNWTVVVYGWSQLKGQVRVMMEAVHYTEWIKQENVNDEQKRKILLVQEIKQFSHDSLGLKLTDNYSKVFDEKGEPVMLMLTASPEFSLEPFQHHFPIIGSFDYIGYFDIEKAYSEKAKYKNKGYDVDLSPVGGWSTLGWFSDPILSSALERNDGSLADLVIHEVFHYTYFKANDIAWNENHANFIGKKGAVKFLSYKYGPESKEIMEYENFIHNLKEVKQILFFYSTKINSMYKSPEFISLDWAAKKSLKDMYYKSIDDSLQDIITQQNRSFEKILLDINISKNAYLSSFLTYNNTSDSLEAVFIEHFHADLNLFIKKITK